MAITFVRTFDNGASAATTVTVPAAGCQQGDTLVVAVRDASGAPGTVVDTAGNTYNLIGTNYNDGANFGAVYVGYMTTALVSGNTLTTTHSCMTLVAEFSGVKSTSPLDKVATAASGQSGTFTSPATATQTASDDLYIAGFETTGSGGAFTDTTSGLSTLISGPGPVGGNFLKYKVLSSTAAVDYSGTLSSGNCGVIVFTLLAETSSAASLFYVKA